MTIVYHESYVKHIQGNLYHPESPARVQAIKDSLEAMDLWNEVISPEPASQEELALVHTPSLIKRLQSAGVGPLDADTYMMAETYQYALNAAGGSLEAMRRVLDHDRPAFVFPRPPGHHAGPHYNGGFCYFNNVALAAALAKERLGGAGQGKVAIVDIDVHHGNGTNDIFHPDPDTLFISTHQFGIFPGTGDHSDTGSGEGEGYTVNIPLMGGAGDASMELAFDSFIMRTLEQFQPGAVLLSLGTDAHYNDPLASIQLSSRGYLDCFRKLLAFTEENCQGRLLVNLEGGYHVESLAEMVTAMVSLVETGEETPLRHTQVFDSSGSSAGSIQWARDVHSRFWKL